jgi:hypothetical protein
MASPKRGNLRPFAAKEVNVGSFKESVRHRTNSHNISQGRRQKIQNRPLRAMEDVGASTHQFDTFRSLARAGTSIEAAMVQTEVPPHVQAFVAHTMLLALSGSTEEVLAAFFYGREDIIPEMFSRLRKILPGARKTNDPLRHFVYYIERHIELDGDSHGPMGRELLDGLVADSPQKDERALHAACNSIKARIDLWDGTLSILRDMRTKTATPLIQAGGRQMGEAQAISGRAH